MSVFPGSEPPLGPADLVPQSPEMSLFARIEGLVGEEAALLRIPAGQRDTAQHDRLRSITVELDRLWETLRERAERRAAQERPT